MNFDLALLQNVITEWEYNLICMVDDNAQFIADDQIASDALGEILERVYQFELCGGKVH
jgi:hypothetical protein